MGQEAEKMSPEKSRQQEFSEQSAREDSCAERELGTSVMSSPPASNKELSAWKKKKQKLLHSKGNYKQGEKTALKLGENNSKRSNRQRINLKNIQATPPVQLQKNKWPNQKMGQRTKQTFLQGRHTDGYKTHEKMLNITHY